MPALYERLMGYTSVEYQAAGLPIDSRPNIPVHQFQAAAAEWTRGNMTGQQAITAFGLNPTEQQESQDLVQTVTSVSGAGPQAMRMLEIEQVLMLAEDRIAPYTTAASVRTRLGVPTR